MAIAGVVDRGADGEPEPADGRMHRRQQSQRAYLQVTPGYVGGTRLDLALIRLKRPFKWNASVQPVCLPDALPKRLETKDYRPVDANVSSAVLTRLFDACRHLSPHAYSLSIAQSPFITFTIYLLYQYYL